MTQPYIVLKQHPMTSKHGGKVFHVTLVGAQDRCEYHTYIDPNNRNYKYWARVVENPSDGFVIRGCQIKKEELISADSRITIVWQTDDANVVFDELYDIWREQDAERANHY
jgi:hypothetical protein